MLKRKICHWLVLADLTVVLTCLANSTEPLKIGMVAPLTGVGTHHLGAAGNRFGHS